MSNTNCWSSYWVYDLAHLFVSVREQILNRVLPAAALHSDHVGLV